MQAELGFLDECRPNLRTHRTCTGVAITECGGPFKCRTGGRHQPRLLLLIGRQDQHHEPKPECCFDKRHTIYSQFNVEFNIGELDARLSQPSTYQLNISVRPKWVLAIDAILKGFVKTFALYRRTKLTTRLRYPVDSDGPIMGAAHHQTGRSNTMTPGQTRVALGAFVVVAFGVAANAILLQPSTAPGAKTASEKAAAQRALERLQRLSIDTPATAPRPAPTNAPQGIPAQPETQRATEPRPSMSPVRPTRATDAAPHPRQLNPPLIAQTDSHIARNRIADGTPPLRTAHLFPNAANPETMPDAPDAEGDPDVIRAVQRELSARGYGQIQPDGVPGLLTRAAIMAFEHDNKMGLTGEATERVLKRLLLGVTLEAAPEDVAGRVRSAHADQVIRTVQQSLANLNYQPGRLDGRIGEETERAIREFEMDHGLVPTGRISAELFARVAKAVVGQKTVAR
jgi:peptidoglycan hydrolase-like protein with peptidoglycan-binding domain